MIAAKSLFKLQSSDADQVKEWPADFRRSSNIHDWFLFPCVEPNTEIDPPTEGRWVRLSIGAHPPLVPSWWWWGRSGGRVVCPSVSWSSYIASSCMDVLVQGSKGSCSWWLTEGNRPIVSQKSLIILIALYLKRHFQQSLNKQKRTGCVVSVLLLENPNINTSEIDNNKNGSEFGFVSKGPVREREREISFGKNFCWTHFAKDPTASGCLWILLPQWSKKPSEEAPPISVFSVLRFRRADRPTKLTYPGNWELWKGDTGRDRGRRVEEKGKKREREIREVVAVEVLVRVDEGVGCLREEQNNRYIQTCPLAAILTN